MRRLWIATGIIVVVGVSGGLLMSGDTTGNDESSASAPAPSHPAGAPELDQAERKAREARAASADRESAVLRRDVRLVSDEVAMLRKQLAESQAAEKPASKPESTESTLPTPEALAEQERQWHEHMAEVDAQFQSEPQDLGWSATTSATIRDTLQADDSSRGTVRSIECRSKSCKIEILDDGSGKVSQSLPIIMAQLGDTLPMSQADHAALGDGRVLMTLYMSRDATAQTSAGFPAAR